MKASEQYFPMVLFVKSGLKISNALYAKDLYSKQFNARYAWVMFKVRYSLTNLCCVGSFDSHFLFWWTTVKKKKEKIK